MTLLSWLYSIGHMLSNEILIQEFGIGIKCELSQSFPKTNAPFQNSYRADEQKKSICRKTEADMGSRGKGEDLSHLWFYFFLDDISCPFYEYLCPTLYHVNTCYCNYCFPFKDAVHSKTNPIQRYQNVKKIF